MPSYVMSFLARAAETSREGLFAVIGGGIRSITTPSLPLAAAMAAIVQVSFAPSEEKKKYKFGLQVLDPAGQQILMAQGEGQPVFDARFPDLPASYNFIFNMAPVIFIHQGSYAFKFLVEGKEVGSNALRVDIISTPGVSS
jgi:hypothetical protein